MVPGSSPGGPTSIKNFARLISGKVFINLFNLSLTQPTGIFVSQDQRMKKVFFTVFTACCCIFTYAQTNNDWKKAVIDRPADHLMIQITSDRWTGVPDSISRHMKGLSRGLGFSFMLDKPFKTDPHWSVAFGLGVNGSSIFFNNMSIDLRAAGTKLPFNNLDSADRFKKYKLVNVFAEVPIELRYTFNPTKESKSWKIAIGGKIGTMINAHTKGKTLLNKNGSAINAYTLKETKRTFFNGTRIVATARVGIGNFSLVANYQITSLIKDAAGPGVRPYQIGICISGL